jgi:hypothetical protein
MEKVSEEWTLSKITSTFKVSFIGNHTNTGTIYLGCGFGWQFGISTNNSTLYVYFNPHRFNTNFSVTVSAGRKARPKDTANQVQQTTYALNGGARSFANYPMRDVARESFLELTVTFPSDIPIPILLSPATKRILNNVLLGKESIDTKFFAFSRRLRSGGVCHPLPLFATASTLQGHSQYLDILLFGEGFKEAETVDLSTATEPEFQPDYDYESDSDLESVSQDDECELGDIEHSSATQNDLPEVPPQTSPRMRARPASHALVSERIGRVIPIKDTAFATWKALLFYLQSNDIAFLPLKSTRATPQDCLPASFAVDTLSQAPSCSPKSLYRLADKVNSLCHNNCFRFIRGEHRAGVLF